MIDILGEFDRASLKLSFAKLHESTVSVFRSLDGSGLDEGEVVAVVLGAIGNRELRGEVEPLIKLWYERWKRESPEVEHDK